MNILDRYIVVSLIKTTALALFVLLMLLSFFTLIEELDSVGRGNYDVWQALRYMLLTMPKLAFELFPITAVIGSITTLGLFARSNELLVLRTAGVSQMRLSLALCQGAGILIVCALLVSEWLLPYAEKNAKLGRAMAISQQYSVQSTEGFWSKNDRSFVYINEILLSQRIAGLQIYEFDYDDKLTSKIDAKWAVYKDNGWLLEDVIRVNISPAGIKKTRLEQFFWQTDLKPDVIDLSIVNPQFLALVELFQYIQYLKLNEQDSAIYVHAFWSKIVYPFSILMMVLIAVPMIKNHTRSLAISRQIFVGCFVGLIFHICYQIIHHIGIIYAVHPIISLALPTLAALLCIAWLIYKASFVR